MSKKKSNNKSVLFKLTNNLYGQQAPSSKDIAPSIKKDARIYFKVLYQVALRKSASTQADVVGTLYPYSETSKLVQVSEYPIENGYAVFAKTMDGKYFVTSLSGKTYCELAEVAHDVVPVEE